MATTQDTGRVPDTGTLNVKTHEEIESWTRERVADALGVQASDVDVHKEFSEFGLDSIVAFALTGEMVEWIGIELSPTLLWEYTTISAMSHHITRQLRERVEVKPFNTGSVLLKNSEARNNLFCICGLGLYKDLAEQFRGRANVYGVYVAPEKTLGTFGEDVNEAYRYTTVEALANRYCEEVVSVQDEGSYYLLGASFGGVLAFEVAQQLTRRGADVRLVGLVDSLLPSAVRPRMYRRVVDFLRSNMELLRSEIDAEDGRATGGRLSYDEMRRYRGKYYWTLGKGYAAEAYDGPVVLFRAKAEKLVGPGFIAEEDMGWGSLVRGWFDIVDMEGSHMGLLTKPHVAQLAAVVHSRIDTTP